MPEHAGVRRKLGDTGLTCHPLGFGCYRISRGNREHEDALRRFLDHGGNLIDTSANYTDGLSESLVGQVLRDHARERAVVVTKGGYLQGRNMELARERDFPEVVRYADGVWHCIHPEFLQTQVERSLRRLGLDKIDVYLLHNPEYFLTDRIRRSRLAGGDYDEFYRRIRQAFEFLETEVERGRISWYGISSNNYGLSSGDPAMTSVARCLDEARSLRAGHHFRIVQLPLNLCEPGGAIEKNNEGGTVLEFCRDRGLGVLVNRPLNAFTGGRMIRLADFVKPGDAEPSPDDLSRLIMPIREHERRIALELRIGLCAGGIGIAGVLDKLVPQLQSSTQWEGVAGHYVVGPLQAWLRENQQLWAHDMRWQAWVDELVELLNGLFEDIPHYLAFQDQRASNRIRGLLHRAGYPESVESLSRMSLKTLVDLEGLSCVLVGMKKPEYVEDAMAVPLLPPVKGIGILQKFSAEVQEIL